MADATPNHRAELEKIFEAVRADWPSICTNPKMSFDKERDWAIALCMKSAYAADLAIAKWQDSQKALRDCGAIGCTLDPAQKLAYLLPRDGRMVYDLSYMGLIAIAVQSGAIVWAQARRVFAADVFELMGYDVPPVHRCKPFAKREDRGEPIGAYVVVKTPGNDYLTDTMSIEEINDIRARSQSWKEHVADPKKRSPWATDEAEMQKKTVVKHAYKYWPRSEALDRAIHYLNTDGGQGIELTNEDESKTRLAIFTTRLQNAKTGEEVATIWKDREEFKKANDQAGYDAFKALVATRNRELGVAPPPPAATTAPAPTPAPAAESPAPGAGRAATPPPPTAPAARGTAPLSVEGKILLDIEKVSDADAQAAYNALNAIAERIDALPAGDLQNECNDAWNQRLAAIKAKHGHS